LDGQTKSVTDAAPTHNTTTYFYDIAGRLIEEDSVLGNRYYQSDLVNNRTQDKDRNGRITKYDYDNLNRIKSETWVGDGKIFTCTYDKNGNRLTADDGAIEYDYSYDQTDLLTRVDRLSNSSPTVSFKYDYDNIGNLTQTDELIANALTATTIYTYNSRNLNTEIIQTGAGLASKDVKFTYDAAGSNTKVERYLDGLLKLTTTNAFDTHGRLTGIEQQNTTGVIASDSYVLDELDRLTAQTKDGQARSIVYDNTDQVKTVTGSNSEGYTYDKNGNRTGGGYVTASGNRLLSDGVYTYDYDAEGNRTQRTKIVGGAVDLYTWDYRNRLTKIVSKTSSGIVTQTVGYEYDVDDQRVKKTVDGVVEKYYLDGNQIAFVTDGGGNRTFHYLYGLNVDQVLAQDSSAGMVWALADRLGSIDTLTDASGVVVDKRTFDSFGRILSETNPGVSFRYGYTGRERDLESGLDYYRARYYDPNVGRFISVDPMGFGAGDTNLYRYVGNNSTNAIDPSGEISWSDVQNYAYGGLENTDKFVAGFADKLTGGYTTKLRTEIYGDRVAGQHEGFAFNLGQSVGLATGLVTIGLATGGAGIVGGGLDTGFQLWQNHGDFSKIDLTSIAISAVSGRIGASVSSGLGKGGALVAGGAFAETGLGLGARTAINAGVGFNLGYWGKVAENAIRGEDLTNGAWQNGAFGAAGAAAGELIPAGVSGVRKGADELLNPAALTGLDEWLAAGSKGGLRRNFGAIRANSFKNNSTVFYHATSESVASSIVNNGIDLAKGRFNADFGRGFYMTTDKSLAGWTTKRFTNIKEPSFAVFRVGNKELAKLDSLVFNNASSEWADFVTLNKEIIGNKGIFQSELSQIQWMHGGEPYDMVVGPFAKRLQSSNSRYNHWTANDLAKDIHLDTDPIQFSIHTPASIKIFDRSRKSKI
jgi:RHS repeat-associated protein